MIETRYNLTLLCLKYLLEKKITASIQKTCIASKYFIFDQQMMLKSFFIFDQQMMLKSFLCPFSEFTAIKTPIKTITLYFYYV